MHDDYWHTPPLLLLQMGAALGCLTQLSWLNLPISHASTALLPLLHKLPALKQLYLQVGRV
jgi:hypothetical protein